MSQNKTVTIDGEKFPVDEETGLPYVTIIMSHYHDVDWWSLPEGCQEWDRSYPERTEGDDEHLKRYEYILKVVFGTLEMVCNSIEGCRFTPAA